jgi:hypothetical protein
MGKAGKQKKAPAGGKGPASGGLSPEAQEIRTLMRRVPDGPQAALGALAAREEESRERVLRELVRSLGKDFLPFVRGAALGSREPLACSAVRVLPLFGTRAAGDVLLEVHAAHPEGERAGLARAGAEALQARGIHIEIPGGEPPKEERRLALRETGVSVSDRAGSRSVVARLQDGYGVWHALFVLWNDRQGVRDAFLRPFSRQEWLERTQQRLDDRSLAWQVCPPDYARWKVARARTLSAPEEGRAAEHLKDWDELVGPPAAGYEPPDPVANLFEGSPDEAARWLAEAGELFRVPDVERWFVEVDLVKKRAQGWYDLLSRARLKQEDPELKAETAEFLRAAVEEVISAEEACLYRERLVELARICSWRHDEANARRAAAAAAAIDGAAAPSENPFFQALVRRTLLVAAATLRDGDSPARARKRLR